MKLTIGMAVHSDFEGAFFTIQSLRMHHPDVMQDAEIVVISNDPQSANGKFLKDTTGWWYGATTEAKQRSGGGRATLAGFQYHELPTPVGTSAPRDMVFKVAKGDYIVCMDCHVLLEPGSLRRLLDWWDCHPQSMDLISGPLVYYGLDAYSTHFDDVWRQQMWGTSALAWECPCRHHRFSALQTPDGRMELTDLMARHPVATRSHCPECHMALPTIGWGGHERVLAANGFTSLAEDVNGVAFEIPAQGLGVFACRRDAWLGFNDKFRGFGGEEWYIHEKYRQAGRRALCLPGLRWMHRFGRPGGPGYNASIWNKIRNYVIGHAELGLPMDRIRNHFDGLGIIPDAEQPMWRELLANPLNPPEINFRDTAPQPRPLIAKEIMPANELEQIYAAAHAMPSDINEHMPKLRALATGCDYVVEFGMRHGVSTVALLAGQPKTLVSFANSPDQSTDLLRANRGSCQFAFHPGDSLSVEIERCDLLFIDTKDTRSHLAAELQRHFRKVRRWMAFHDTQIFGERGEDGQPGLMHALREFVEANPEWFLAYHSPVNNGLTVLGQLPRDRPQEKVWAWAPGKGPGTELKAILKSLGVEPTPNCDCNNKAIQMDIFGVTGCRENREMIIGWLRDGQVKWGWKDKLMAAANAVATGLAFRINITDPFPGIVDEAIRRAEEKENASAA